MDAITNSATLQQYRRNPSAVGLTERLMRKAHSLWPVKTCAYVAAAAGVSVKAAEQWNAGSRTISVDALVDLLHSEEGIKFLVVLMDGARPKWWKALLRTGLFGSIQRRREADLRLLESIANADEATPSEIPAALLFQDEEFYGAFLEGLASAQAPRSEDRAVVPPKGPR